MKEGYVLRKKLDRRKSMIAAATELFARSGFENTTMQNIADQAEVGIATLFRYFPKKEDLIIAVIQEIIEQQVPYFEKISQSNKNGIEKVDEVLTTYIHYISEENRETSKLLEAFELYISFNFVDKSMIEVIEKSYDKVSTIIKEIIAEGKCDGSIHLSNSDEQAWETIFNLFGTAIKKYALYTFLPNSILSVPKPQELIVIKEMMLTFLSKSTKMQ